MWIMNIVKHVLKQGIAQSNFSLSIAAGIFKTVVSFILLQFFSIAIILTMYFNGGLIPTYLLMRDLNLVGSFWVYIWPGLISERL